MTPDSTLEAPSLSEIRAAAERIRGVALRTPLLPLGVDEGGREIWLKPENLQPIGSFKLRGAGNAMAMAPNGALEHGVYTASAGNMAQGVGWVARRRAIPWSVVVPDHAPQAKLSAIDRLGGRVVAVPFDRWWQVIVEHRFEGLSGFFIHPVVDRNVVAGNGTIGLEILEDLPDVDTVIVPYGGGGLIAGIGTAIKALSPRVRVLAAEVETAAPLRAALDAEEPRAVSYTASFVDGIGSKSVLPSMWPVVRSVVDGSEVVTLDAVRAAVRTLVARAHLVAEGAGAAPVAAALARAADPLARRPEKVVCVVSGGNLDPATLADILR